MNAVVFIIRLPDVCAQGKCIERIDEGLLDVIWNVECSTIGILQEQNPGIYAHTCGIELQKQFFRVVAFSEEPVAPGPLHNDLRVTYGTVGYGGGAWNRRNGQYPVVEIIDMKRTHGTVGIKK